ncbi:hypothetical protein SCLCIDRAFT_27017 [Scleroderma citrinum Foug A]|uniref:Uncharacterized protein n=1 Tax=Scleroderma citrinum Foug A TaxID=1036808 RepID=A0A0C3A5F6_9AGAM|nr:hypothetical protein SCLCIDRAFT_27017 [Scleroderma citrinum Foug A]
MVDCSEVLEFELGVPGMEPFKEYNFVIVEERSLKDIGDPLTLLCCKVVDHGKCATGGTDSMHPEEDRKAKDRDRLQKAQ